jgi:hypothetical protein
LIVLLPATGVIQLIGEERGKNFSLGETLALAARLHLGKYAAE